MRVRALRNLAFAGFMGAFALAGAERPAAVSTCEGNDCCSPNADWCRWWYTSHTDCVLDMQTSCIHWYHCQQMSEPYEDYFYGECFNE